MAETYSLTVDRVIPGPIEEVFDAWLDPASMQQWMKPGSMTLLTAEIDPVVGGQYTLTFSGIGKDTPHEGTYVEIDRPHRLVFTWKSGNTGDTLVTIACSKLAARETTVTLTHERFESERARDGYRGGWGGVLQHLEHVLKARMNANPE